MEAGIYAIGRRELAAQFADETDETVERAMIEAQILLTYHRDLNNLSIQEARLRRQHERTKPATGEKATVRGNRQAFRGD